METKNREEKLEVLRRRNGYEYACYVGSNQVINLPIVGSNHGHVLVDADYSDIRSPKQFKFKII